MELQPVDKQFALSAVLITPTQTQIKKNLSSFPPSEHWNIFVLA